MSAVRERLAAKARRSVIVPVQVSDPGPAREAYEKAERTYTLLSLSAAETKDAAVKRRVKAAERARDKAREAYAAHFVEVTFQAASPADVEAVLGAHTGPDGEWDEQSAVAPLAALCAAEEDLRDEEWWTSQLNSESGTWSRGERAHLWISLLNINNEMPSGSLPKG